MIKDDPSIPKDIDGFLKKVNELNINQVVKQAVIVQKEQTVLTSIALMNGGEATLRDVQDAIDIISQEPILQEAQDKYTNLISAIQSGEIKDSSDIIDKFSE